MSFAPVFYSLSRNTVSSDMGYAHKKRNLLHRGYNPVMKNKHSDKPKGCWMQLGSGSTCFTCAEDVDMSLKKQDMSIRIRRARLASES